KDTNKPVFPDAELIVSDAEYKFWTDPAVIDRLPEARKGLARRIQAVFPTWKNIRQVTGEPEVAPGIRFVSSPGHTPRHRAFHLPSGTSQVMISNDTAYVPALVVANPGWHGQYDQDAALAEASRRKLLDRVIADKIMICGYHFPFPGAGIIAKDGGGYALTVMKTRAATSRFGSRCNGNGDHHENACALDLGGARRCVACLDRRARRRQRHLPRGAGPHVGTREDQGQRLQRRARGAHADAGDASECRCLQPDGLQLAQDRRLQAGLYILPQGARLRPRAQRRARIFGRALRRNGAGR